MKSPKEQEQERQRQIIVAACERYLSGHGRPNPAASLTELAAEVAPHEIADHYGTGALIEDFEQEIARLLGKEDALFLPSGTMAQQIALRIWSGRKQCRSVAFHPTCHLEINEQRAYQLLHGLHAHLIGHQERLLTLADLHDIAEPIAALLLELPQRHIGGQLPTWDDLQAQTTWARDHGVAVHLDGARLWEAGPFYGRSYAEIANVFDSVYVSFYKGIGAIAGAALAGSADFIAEARLWQRRHGGNLISLFPYVLSARLNLRRRLNRFPAYHRRALEIAEVLNTLPGVIIKPDPPHAHMMHVYLPGNIDKLLAASLLIAAQEKVLLFNRLASTALPGYSVMEVAIGDAADALSNDEIRELFTRVLAA